MLKHIIIGILALCCTGCISKKKTVQVYRGAAMSTPYMVIVNASPSLPPVDTIIEDTFFVIDHLYNKKNNASELSALNRATDSFQCSQALYSLLQSCGQFVALSEGRFDPTIESLAQIWKPSLSRGTIPSKEAIQLGANRIGWELLTLDEPCVVRKKHPEVLLDLGGIAKGVAVDLLLTNIQNAGYSNIFIEWGGEVRALGGHPEGRPWRVGIKNPHNQEELLTLLHIDQGSFATCGDYHQYRAVDDHGRVKQYFLFFDRSKLSPCESTQTSLASVTIHHESCMTANALALILLQIGDKKKAQAFFDEKILPHFPTATSLLLTHTEIGTAP